MFGCDRAGWDGAIPLHPTFGFWNMRQVHAYKGIHPLVAGCTHPLQNEPMGAYHFVPVTRLLPPSRAVTEGRGAAVGIARRAAGGGEWAGEPWAEGRGAAVPQIGEPPG
jgi:hypothetical protein